MSGGHFNYVYSTIENELAGNMLDDELNDLVVDFVKLAKALEWYESNDTDKETYLKEVGEFKKKWFKSSREERLKGYIDTQLEETKQRLYDLIGVEEQNSIATEEEIENKCNVFTHKLTHKGG